MTKMTPWQMRASPMTRVSFRGQRVHVKRDDVFHLAGNKMRKLYWFLQQNETFFQDKHFFSYGGTQSNAMLAIAQLAHAKCVPFTYFSRGLQIKSVVDNIHSEDVNLAIAQSLGMHHVELSVDEYQDLAQNREWSRFTRPFLDKSEQEVLIPQGAAFSYAEEGFRVLAGELNAYCGSFHETESSQLEGPKTLFSVVVPCGTGTSAFYLAQHLDPSIKLFAVPCVGDSAYLLDQFHALASDSSSSTSQSEAKLPEILHPTKKARFGRLSWPLFDLHHELLQTTGIEFDLIYASFAWQTLLEPANLARMLDNDSPHGGGPPRELLYVHTGGISGNPSMLARYQRARCAKGVETPV